MDTVLDILQAIGIGAAIGVRAFVPALLVGALAAGDLGVDFDGTSYAFLEEPPFLVALLVGLVVADLVRRRTGDDRLDSGLPLVAYAAVAGAIAALEGAGSLADRGHSPVLGGLLALAAALLALLAVRPLFARVRARLDAGAASLLPVYREGLALVTAALSVLFPPLALLAVAGLVFLLLGGQRREGEKYAGLRILR